MLDLGLLPAVQSQARQFSKYSGGRAAVHAEGEVGGIPEEYSTCVYRVIQECRLGADRNPAGERVLDVVVRDDGRGFDRSNGAAGGLGLIGMEERVRELGAG